MATFRVDFLGCKVSHVDAHEVREALLGDGHQERDDARADVAVISTCCVTNEALAKSRKAAARAARTHRRVYVTGCGANLEGGSFAGLPGNVVVVAKRSEETARFVAGDVGAIGCVQAEARLDRVRAFVKIQDGCSFSCNFCVIPLVRGASRSRSAEAVLAEIDRRVAQGHREVVLTGINLGCFRDRAAGYDLPRLVREAGATPGLERLRLSSIEINHVDAALVAALRETPTVSRHLHVPLQSGDDGVLRAMGRRYTTATYLRRLAPLAAEFNLTSDVIVGFPAEDDAAFEQTLVTVERAGLDQGARLPVLAAARDRSPPRTTGFRPRSRRSGARELRALSHELCLRRWMAKVGAVDTRARRPAGSRLRRRLLAVARRRSGRRARRRSGRARDRGGDPCRSSVTTASSAASPARAPTCIARKGSSRSTTSTRRRPCTYSSCPSTTSTRSATYRRVRGRRESKRMLEFVAETAAKVGLTDYRVLVNVGAGAGQTVFHLHWHILGGGPGTGVEVPAAVAIAEAE